jgi:hypothetical protein
LKLKLERSLTGPDIVNVHLLEDALDPVVLLLAGDGDAVHAEPPAVVAGPLPVPLGVLAHLQPGEVVGLPKLLLVDQSYNRSIS